MKSHLTYLKKLELFKELDNLRDGQFYAIIDQKIKNHLPQWITFSPNVFWLKNPEEDKKLEAYSYAVEYFLKSGITRDSTLYAFGGGATTDFAGFVAATILRGIAWVSTPTTLLGMVDGGIGGKVAINMPQGKNLLGAFHMPERVLICSDFLTTLSESEMMSGKGEVIKYGFLSQEINQLILNQAPMEEIAMACAQFKTGIVERDFKDTGERIFLNLGHTLGHAFESTLKIPHGQAVIMGMKYLFKIYKLNEATLSLEKMIKALNMNSEKFNLTEYRNFNLKVFLDHLEQDKKKNLLSLKLVLVRNVGDCYVEEVDFKDFKTKISQHDDFRYF